jgi:hypothetical protein
VYPKFSEKILEKGATLGFEPWWLVLSLDHMPIRVVSGACSRMCICSFYIDDQAQGRAFPVTFSLETQNYVLPEHNSHTLMDRCGPNMS